MDIKQAIARCVDSKDLTEEEAQAVFDQIMSGEAEPAQIASFITALRMKGETVEEITGAVRVMRAKALRIKALPGGQDREGLAVGVLDTCGTGGSGKDVFNVSTTSAFVLAACGAKVAKHGNRGASSRCGSADVLEELGVRIDTPPEVTEKCLNSIGIAFMFAPLFHSAMKHAVGVRKAIAIRTVFNILGPLSNPAGAEGQVLGVYDRSLAEPMARVLRNLGCRRASVVHGDDGLDEASIASTSTVCELREDRIRTYSISPEQFGLERASLEEVKGGTCAQNASMVRSVLKGVKGPCRDIVLLNSALALMTAGSGGDAEDAAALAARAIDSGQAAEKLDQLIAMTNA